MTKFVPVSGSSQALSFDVLVLRIASRQGDCASIGIDHAIDNLIDVLERQLTLWCFVLALILSFVVSRLFSKGSLLVGFSQRVVGEGQLLNLAII